MDVMVSRAGASTAAAHRCQVDRSADRCVAVLRRGRKLCLAGLRATPAPAAATRKACRPETTPVLTHRPGWVRGVAPRRGSTSGLRNRSESWVNTFGARAELRRVGERAVTRAPAANRAEETDEYHASIELVRSS